jgi:hypothetical protein
VTDGRNRITYTKAARFIAAMVSLQQCDDCPDALRIALDDARAAISPFYDD